MASDPVPTVPTAPPGAVRRPSPLKRLTERDARPFFAVAVLATAAALAIPADPEPLAISGLIAATLVTAVALPCILRILRPGRWVVVVALLALAVPLMVQTTQNLTNDSIHPRLRYHDGGVLATRAAARDVMAGRNPYAASFRDDIPSYWTPLMDRHGNRTPNPLVEHYPYLPGAFLVQIPFLVVGDALGLEWDPRLIGVALLLATGVVVARRREAPWARAATILVLGSAFPVTYGAWGRNDVIPGCLVLLTAFAALTRPRLAGALFALAVSFKFLVLVAAIPLVWWVVHRQGKAALRRWWTAPALLAALCLPFFVADPRAFIDDTLLFNLGLTDLVYPTSGMGLPVAAPGIFHGPVLALATLASEATALALPVLVIWRYRRAAAIPFGAAVGTWFLIWPSRTFQTGYLTLIVVLASAGWLLIDGVASDPDPEPDEPGDYSGVV